MKQASCCQAGDQDGAISAAVITGLATAAGNRRPGRPAAIIFFEDCRVTGVIEVLHRILVRVKEHDAEIQASVVRVAAEHTARSPPMATCHSLPTFPISSSFDVRNSMI
jgi:hypothetical protein